jgi:hypothetical protein
MPLKCQIVGVNSVTNIELGKGVLPVPIIRNADWFEKISPIPHIWPLPLARQEVFKASGACMLCGYDHLSFSYRIVANGRFTRLASDKRRYRDARQTDLFDGPVWGR